MKDSNTFDSRLLNSNHFNFLTSEFVLYNFIPYEDSFLNNYYSVTIIAILQQPLRHKKKLLEIILGLLVFSSNSLIDRWLSKVSQWDIQGKGIQIEWKKRQRYCFIKR